MSRTKGDGRTVPLSLYVLRDELTSGSTYIFDEITEKLKGLTPQQRKTAADILDAYIKNL